MSHDSHSRMNAPLRGDETLLSVVIPVYNEQAVLRPFHQRLSTALQHVATDVEILYVDDGSNDGSAAILNQLHTDDKRVAVLDLSRNFGKEIAVTAGLESSSGDVVVVIDADLQDPPELIPEFLIHWREGYDVVYGQRTRRAGETVLKRLTAHAFYRLLGFLSRVKIPRDSGDFRLLSRRAVDALIQLREQHRFMKGLFAWIGFPQKAVPYERDPRYAGRSKWSYWKLWNFALEGITSFSTVPLRVATYVGVLISLGAFIYAVFIIIKTITYGDPVPGYPSLMVVILFLGGIQLLAIGIVGEYLARLFDEAKDRPLYFINQFRPAEGMVSKQNTKEETL